MSKWQDRLDGLPGLSDDEKARAEVALLKGISAKDRKLLFRGDKSQASRRIKALLVSGGFCFVFGCSLSLPEKRYRHRLLCPLTLQRMQLRQRDAQVRIVHCRPPSKSSAWTVVIVHAS